MVTSSSEKSSKDEENIKQEIEIDTGMLKNFKNDLKYAVNAANSTKNDEKPTESVSALKKSDSSDKLAKKTTTITTTKPTVTVSNRTPASSSQTAKITKTAIKPTVGVFKLSSSETNVAGLIKKSQPPKNKIEIKSTISKQAIVPLASSRTNLISKSSENPLNPKSSVETKPPLFKASPIPRSVFSSASSTMQNNKINKMSNIFVHKNGIAPLTGRPYSSKAVSSSLDKIEEANEFKKTGQNLHNESTSNFDEMRKDLESIKKSLATIQEESVQLKSDLNTIKLNNFQLSAQIKILEFNLEQEKTARLKVYK